MLVLAMLNVLLLAISVGSMAVPVMQVGFNDVTIAAVEADMLQIATHRCVAFFRQTVFAYLIRVGRSVGNWARRARH